MRSATPPARSSRSSGPSSSVPRPRPRCSGSTASDSISPIRGPVTHVSAIQVSADGHHVREPVADERLVRRGEQQEVSGLASSSA